MDLFDDVSFEVNCPECDAEITVSVKQIGSSIICPQCKVSINLKDDGLKEELNQTEKSLEELFKNF